MQQNQDSKYQSSIRMQQCSMGDISPNNLTEVQKQIIWNVNEFMRSNNLQIEQRLKRSDWRDMYEIIICEDTDNNVKVVCCSALKWLIFHKRYVDDVYAVFKAFLGFYMRDYGNGYLGNKPQEIVEIILKSIPNTYLSTKQKHGLLGELLGEIKKEMSKGPKIMKIISLLVEQEQAEHINNEKIVGPILQYLGEILQLQIESGLKLLLYRLGFNLLQNILDIINDDEDIEANLVQEYLSSSLVAKRILMKIIFEGSGQVVITGNKILDEVKLLALQLYSSIWIYYVDEDMFRICLNSIVIGESLLYDQQLEIMSKVVCLVERSIGQESYYEMLYQNVQVVSVGLLKYLGMSSPFENLLESDPQEYVEIQEDLCMTQQSDYLITKVCSLISGLCLNIDGYMSCIGMICLMVVKAWGSGLEDVDKGEEYMENLNKLWVGDLEYKVGICSLVICTLSDQFQKRFDFTKPLTAQLTKIVNKFDVESCKLAPYLICRFMLLYTYMGHPKNLSVFFGYCQKGKIYAYQLQSCYKILLKYSTRHPEYKPYVTYLSRIILETDRLSPAIQNEIINGELNNEEFVWKIFEKLVRWLENAMDKNDRIVGSKMSNLIKVMIDRMQIKDYVLGQGLVWGYLEGLWRREGILGKQVQQYTMQILVSYVKRFVVIQNNNERLLNILRMGQGMVGVKGLSVCFDLFVELTRYLREDLIYVLVEIYLRCSRDGENREQDLYECYYGIQICMIRLKQLGKPPPLMDILEIIDRGLVFKQQTLKTKMQMLAYSYVICVDNMRKGILSRMDLDVDVAIYDSRVYCLYLFQVLDCLCEDIEMSRKVLKKIMLLLMRQKRVGNLIKKYQEIIYTQNGSECQLNAYSIYLRLGHPYLRGGQDVYMRFRECWERFPYRGEILSEMTNEEKDRVRDLYQMWKGEKKVRKIYKVKMGGQDGMNEEIYDENKNGQK